MTVIAGRANRGMLACARYVHVISLGVACASVLSAQSPACSREEARAFDFWAGGWAIEQRIATSTGTWLTFPATTRVTRVLEGCALLEEWQGDVQFFWEGMTSPQPMRGLSVRAWDPQSRTWRIHWMDTRTPLFAEPYVGVFSGGRGEFYRDFTTPGGPRRGRIVFERAQADAVRWELAVSADTGRSWTTLWVMQMRRIPADTAAEARRPSNGPTAGLPARPAGSP